MKESLNKIKLTNKKTYKEEDSQGEGNSEAVRLFAQGKQSKLAKREVFISF